LILVANLILKKGTKILDLIPSIIFNFPNSFPSYLYSLIISNTAIAWLHIPLAKEMVAMTEIGGGSLIHAQLPR
jgi:hypothetical protein